MHEKEYRWTDDKRPLHNLEPAPAKPFEAFWDKEQREFLRENEKFLEAQKSGNAPVHTIRFVPEGETITFQQFILWCHFCETEFLAREYTKANPVTWNHQEREQAFAVFFCVMWLGKGDSDREEEIWHDFYMEKVLKEIVMPVSKRANIRVKDILNGAFGLIDDYGCPLIKREERNDICD